MTSVNNDNIDDNHGEAAYKFYHDVLGSPRHILAPMVDQSELPWRMLSRQYSCHLTYTPMIHAAMFVKSGRYRRQMLVTCPDDKPLIVQFCANNPDIFVKACQLAQDHCDAIDLNLGCPQSIAKRGHYGAFLQDDWERISEMIKKARTAVRVPLTAKIRVFPQVERTIAYARMLEEAGVVILTVHGRTREQKGIHTGLADWNQIKIVKESVKIPVFANGNIQYLSDVEKCLKETGVDGVMTAEGNLHNPALFSGKQPPACDMALEYLDLVRQYPCSLSYSRGHVFKLLQHILLQHLDFRSVISNAKDIDDLEKAVNEIKKICGPSGCILGEDKSGLPYAHWICQPYQRPPPQVELIAEKTASAESESNETSLKRKQTVGKDDQTALILAEERKRRKADKRAFRLLKAINKSKPGSQFEQCVQCVNRRGLQCDLSLCKTCCVNRPRKVDSYVICSFHNTSRKLSHKSDEKLEDKSETVSAQ